MSSIEKQFDEFWGRYGAANSWDENRKDAALKVWRAALEQQAAAIKAVPRFYANMNCGCMGPDENGEYVEYEKLIEITDQTKG